MIKAITFDLDGVYFPSGKNNFIKALGNLRISEEEAKRVFLKSPEMNELYKTGQLSDHEFWSWAKREWNIDGEWENLVRLLIDGYDIDKAVVEIIKKLRARGYRALICSNNFPARVNGLQQKFHFLDNFDAAVFSYEVGATKPSKRIFKELLKRAKTKPESIVFSDDNPNNLSEAEELGIKVFLYSNFGEFISKLRDLGVKI